MGIQTLQLILIAGAGRNVGKTTLGCAIIEVLSGKGKVTAIKISKHVHTLNEKQKVIAELPGLLIAEELDMESNKDSSRFLRAGAFRSLFIQVTEDSFPKLASWIKENLTGIVICETGYLGNFLTPAKAFFVGKENGGKEINWTFPYETTFFDGKEFHPSIQEMSFNNSSTVDYP